MWEQLDKPLTICLIVALPLAWGLGAEYVFHLLRRRKAADTVEEAEESDVA